MTAATPWTVMAMASQVATTLFALAHKTKKMTSASRDYRTRWVVPCRIKINRNRIQPLVVPVELSSRR